MSMKRILALFLLFISLTVNAVEHPWKSARVVYFGDSITDPGLKVSGKNYWSYLNDWLEMTPYVYGKSGPQRLYPMHGEQGMYVPGGNDNLHPNAEGHRRMALCLYYQLLTLPCRFDVQEPGVIPGAK